MAEDKRLLASLPPPRRLRASKTQNPASVARNWQVPRRSGSAIGVASEVILRATAWRHPRWHQVGSRGILLQRASSALRTRATTGVIVVLDGGDLPRVTDLRGPLLLSSSAGRDACRCTGGEFTKFLVCWLVVLTSRRAV